MIRAFVNQSSNPCQLPSIIQAALLVSAALRDLRLRTDTQRMAHGALFFG